MATITITRTLLEQGGAVDVFHISAFQRNSMEFDVEHGVLTGTYATVKIGGYEFRAVKTATLGTTDSYIMDVTTILPNLMVLPENNSDLSALIRLEGVTIKVYESSGSLLIQNNAHPDIVLSFAYCNIGVGGGLNDIYNNGASRAIYHNGKICFFSTAFIMGSVNLTINTITATYTLTNLYNNITLNANQNVTGTLTSTDIPLLSIPLYYKHPYGDEEIAWLNRDGGWSFWNFRKISEEINVEKSNEIETYYRTNAATISKSRMISAQKTVLHAFDTLAYDPTHFAQLCEIQESLAVIWNGKLVRVRECNSLTAVCKQNLRFNIILEVDENIAGY